MIGTQAIQATINAIYVSAAYQVRSAQDEHGFSEIIAT